LSTDLEWLVVGPVVGGWSERGSGLMGWVGRALWMTPGAPPCLRGCVGRVLWNTSGAHAAYSPGRRLEGQPECQGAPPRVVCDTVDSFGVPATGLQESAVGPRARRRPYSSGCMPAASTLSTMTRKACWTYMNVQKPKSLSHTSPCCTT
jgi:hypothetical protein